MERKGLCFSKIGITVSRLEKVIDRSVEGFNTRRGGIIPGIWRQGKNLRFPADALLVHPVPVCKRQQRTTK
jgi:hypothetical protein